MKDVYEQLAKKYDHPIVHHKQIKKAWKKQKEALIELGIQVHLEDDASYFQYEIMMKSFSNKTKLEDTFFDTYVTMYDYWKDLTYQERKKQMNIDIDKRKETLPHFDYEGQEIYMPAFDPKFNHLYTDEIVLLDLKQYHVFIRSFEKEVQQNYYGVLPFLHDFSSAEVLVYRGQDFVLYHALVNRYYLYKDNVFYKAVSLDPKHLIEDASLQEVIAMALLDENEDALIACILEHTLLSKHMCKQLSSYQHKKAKKLAKQQRKAEKK